MGIRLVSRMEKSFALSLAVMLAASSPLAAASSGSANPSDEGLRLKTAITVEGESITLGDIFQGYIPRPEKVVAQAPKPGQRMTLTADWLADVARTYGLDWAPSNSFDRATVYQPGQTITSDDILAAVKSNLIAGGMPATYGLTSSAPVAAVTVAMTAAKNVEVREALFDANSRTFSALVQIPPGDPQATFIQLRGVAFATVQVPVLKQAVGKTSTITADMIDLIALPEDQMRPSTVIDPNVLVGKTPKMFLRAGQPIREMELTQVNLVEVPVFAADIDHETRITDVHVKMALMDAAALPADAVTTTEFLLGKRPRRSLAGGVPIRRTDVAIMRQVEVPVPARDLPRGTTMTEADITWMTMDEADIVGSIAMEESEIVGQVTRLTLRSGQPVRKHAIAKAVAVVRGQAVTVVWSVASINLTAQAKAMEQGGVGDLIRVTNTKSNQTMLAEIIDSRTVRVAAPDQTSSR
jgi:flagella basal body P-ring formation protein FlgA